MPSNTDLAIDITRLRAGDDEEIARLLCRLLPVLYQTVQGYHVAEMDEDRIVASIIDFLLRKPERLAQFSSEAQIEAYTKHLARNSAIRHKRRLERRSYPIDEEETKPELSRQLDSAMYGILEKALEQLSVYEREVFALRVFDQMTYSEIANLLDIDSFVAKARYRRAVRHLSKFVSGGAIHES